MPALQFNADEIFTMAEQIEINGAKFYRKAARANPSAARLLEQLAAMEDAHYRTFSELHAAIGERAREQLTADPEGEAGLFAQAFANENVFDVRKDPSEKLKGTESLAQVLNMAIGIEKESIVFYVGLKEMTPKNAGRDKIDHILQEELKHVAILSNELKKLAK